jgi:putative membrane protein
MNARIEDVQKRDALAVKRTHLANVRTLLAYLRTALGMAGLGIFLIKYEPSSLSRIAGVIMICIAIAIIIWGLIDFMIEKKKINLY